MERQYYKQSYLPQVSAPYLYVVDQLDNEGVGYKFVKVRPNQVKPVQGIVDLCKVSAIANATKSTNPIWLAKDNDILDGHHRYAALLNDNIPMKAIQIDLPHVEASRVLNKIMDLFHYQRQRAVDEVVAQDQLNAEPDLMTNMIVDGEDTEVTNKKKEDFIGYREDDLKSESKIGNFFCLYPQKGFKKFELSFDKLLDTDTIGIVFNGDVAPPVSLARIWFPTIDLNIMAKKYDTKIENIANRLVAEKAKKLGYDGIKYGSSMIQGF
ncbi:MAG: hypothetical protein HC836_45470 [Richelia sp. RM2_1_2]|nr:hypothetical protein [Richelia sp. RM2_1_2]